ncbi:bifunctional serine/threonine-protein kinase/ABC transporter substrate-binding protein [Streptomyces bambusae]|uniref:bifunctional serine/threonine-protein kinase/ABC transporter substrate-binding protein n=1 Tax=Streptomyces bambusae TaxID=1550616 RepID=UPI001CFD0A05|nr:bifunctional serine/threonine-protein kinase/ABC transporter substrate-binding protein [Streptomyces bambusae]MCB5165430.1 bifunctional serine/threonine-protein kinase/ABC transporter substrate-binding protein [Streptomyces bambusae]
MEPLLHTDPSRIAGYRLLGRLGAGGMGVVYLGRTEEGALAAVKVIRADLADESDFRARFRREAAIAARVRSPWVVEVMGADPDAAEPWLATAFVPGPSLAEAVAAHGALPARSVRVLGSALAKALAVLHDRDLVHRDVKPGNVLLGVDGPRLIDFGIARGGEDTALTAADVIVGTPGFLSPEQAAGRPAGPPGDVFSLGCLLAYAATGQPPFGTGAVDALLYRTVHDEPSFGPDGIADRELAALLQACLAKDPDARPTAAELDRQLAEDVPGGSADWLPDPVVATIAERAALLLALPGIEETLADPAATVEPPAPAGRRRFLALAGGAAVLAAAGGLTAYLAGRDDQPSTPAGPPPRRWVIGVHADLSGPGRAAGRAQERGVRLAVAAFNARKDKPFTLAVRTADDGGDPARSPGAAAALIGDRDVFAVVGPTANASVGPVLEQYGQASVPLITVSAAGLVFGIADRRSFFQACPVSTSHIGAINMRLVGEQKVRTLGVLCDRDGDTDAWQLAYLVDATVTAYGGRAYPRVVPRGDADLAPVLKDMLGHGIDGFFYTGSAQGAAEAARQLDAAGFRGPRAADYAVLGDEFVRRAGPSGEGWQFLTPYTGTDTPQTAALVRAHRTAYGTAPGVWTAEAYDVAGLVAGQLAQLARAGRRPARADLLTALAKTDHRGLARSYAFDEEFRTKTPVSYLHRIERGAVRYVGPAPSAPQA